MLAFNELLVVFTVSQAHQKAKKVNYIKRFKILIMHFKFISITFFLQINETQETLLAILDIVVQRKLQIVSVWYGPFIATVECFRPDTIRAVLKGNGFVT